MENEQLKQEADKQAIKFAEQFKHQISSEGLENIVSDFVDAFLAGASFVSQNRDEEIAGLIEALESIANDEGETCQLCEGNGKLWADGKAHYPSHDGLTIFCPRCGGEGRIYNDFKEIASKALENKSNHSSQYLEKDKEIAELKEYIRKAEILIETLAANDTMNDLKKI